MTTIFTVGHGNRAVEEFVTLLRVAGMDCVMDVRAYPASRRHPQFARDALEGSLARAGIRYEWEGTALGGRRRPAVDSPHTALRSPGFRAYADHMVREEFRAGVRRVEAVAAVARVAVMCAERLPWECHRYLIADHLVASGASVVHLINEGDTREHSLNPLARLRNGKLVYDGNTQDKLEL